MPTLTQPVTGPIVDCDACGGDMTYLNGVTFQCIACNERWAPDWPPVLVLHSDLCVLSQAECHANTLGRLTSMIVHGYEIGGDPDHSPTVQELIDSLPLNYLVSERLFVATAAWEYETTMREELYA
jgi:hypothetical protein